MAKKVTTKKLKGAKKSLRRKELEKAALRAAKAAAAANNPSTNPSDPQVNAGQDESVSDGYASDIESLNPNERERFKRVIRPPINGDNGTMGRRLLVTGGATVPFVALLKEATGKDFLQALQDHGFTHLYLQCGAAHDQIEARLEGGGGDGLQIETFAFSRDLKSLFREYCRGEKGVRPAGVVMGHAGEFQFFQVSQTRTSSIYHTSGRVFADILTVYSGTGTISDAMEVDCALVIVANTTLMDDHQSAFAAEMASEYPTIVQGQLG